MPAKKTRPATVQTQEQTQSQAEGKENIWQQFASMPNPGYSDPPPANYNTWRRMMCHPSIAIARAIATAPIKSAGWAINADEDVPQDRKEFVEEQLVEHWDELLRNMLFALDFGWQGFEKVFEVVDGHLYGYDKIKPLKPELTDIVEDKTTGAFLGFKQKDVTLDPFYCFLFTYDEEHGNRYGRPRHENCREEWHQHRQTSAREGIYTTRAAGAVPAISYPQGQSRDKAGNLRDNYEIAVDAINQLARGKGVALPQSLRADWDILRQAGAPAEMLLQWRVDYFEAARAHGDEFVNQMRYKDSLMLRGWLVLERAATEGQFGTKAEAGEHGDTTVEIAEGLLRDILHAINRYVVNPLLILNWGESVKGTIWAEPEGLTADQKAFLRTVLVALLGQPSNIDLVQNWVDVPKMVEQASLPVNEAAQTKSDELPVLPTPKQEKAPVGTPIDEKKDSTNEPPPDESSTSAR